MTCPGRRSAQRRSQAPRVGASRSTPRTAQSVQVQTRSRFPGGLGVAVQQVRVSEAMGKSGLTGDGRATLYVRATELSQVVEVVSLGCF